MAITAVRRGHLVRALFHPLSSWPRRRQRTPSCKPRALRRERPDCTCEVPRHAPPARDDNSRAPASRGPSLRFFSLVSANSLLLTCQPEKRTYRSRHDRLHPEGWSTHVAYPGLQTSSRSLFPRSDSFIFTAPRFTSAIPSGTFGFVQRRNYAEALHECAGTPGPVARVVHAAIIRHNAPRAELREIVQEAGPLEVPKLERFLGVLATLAYLTPLIGLLGTVAGMMEASDRLLQQRLRDSHELSTGIYRGLLTAAAGLVVATPTLSATAISPRGLTLPDARHGTRRIESRPHVPTDHAPSARSSVSSSPRKSTEQRFER